MGWINIDPCTDSVSYFKVIPEASVQPPIKCWLDERLCGLK